MQQRLFVPAPPTPPAYGLTAAIALGLGLAGGFAVGLYALGAAAFGWPAPGYAGLVQAHGQVQVLGLAGLLILGVGGLLLPRFWHAKLPHPRAIPLAGAVVGAGVLAQLIGQPLEAGSARVVLLWLAALLPPIGFVWGGSQLLRARLSTGVRPAGWETLLALGGLSLVVSLALRVWLLGDLAATGLPASYGGVHGALLVLELEGFVLAATIGVGLRLIPSLARTRPVTGPVVALGILLLGVAVVVRAAGLGALLPAVADVGSWIMVAALLVLFWATGLGRPGLAPTVVAPATLLPGRSRQVLRVAWAGLIVGMAGRAAGAIASDAATHALTSAYLLPLILVVGIRMLPRVSAYPIHFPVPSGALVWLGVGGGVLRAFGGLLPPPLGVPAMWLGGLVLTVVLAIFALLAWSPWGAPTGLPRPGPACER